MPELKELLNSVPNEIYVERYVGDVDIERLDGTTIKDACLLRKEKIADDDDLDSVYEREYVAEHNDEEIYLGNSGGDNLIIKERN